MKGWVEALLILGLSSAVAWFGWFWHPNVPRFGEDGFERPLDEVLSWERALWVDARLKEEFEADRIPEAVLLNLEDWEALFGEFVMGWDPEVPIVVYCKSQACMRSHEVAERLKVELGAENVYVLKDGWEAWLEGSGRK